MGTLAALSVGVILVAAIQAAGAPTAGTSRAATSTASDTTSRPAATSTAATFAAAPAGARITADGWFAPVEVKRPALPQQVKRAFVIPIREEITQKTFDAFKRKAKRCRQSGAELIILDMDTWGGEVGPALDVARMLKHDLGDTYTVCFVRTRAVSAGSLLGMACTEFVVIDTSCTLGDCMPIVTGGEGYSRAGEKIETVLRSEFRESAQQHGYSIPLSESLVSLEAEVWLIRDKQTKELRFVYPDDPAYSGQIEAPSGATSRPTSSGGKWQLVRIADKASTLLTMTGPEAMDNGFARHMVSAPNADPYSGLRKVYNIEGEIAVLDDNWSETMVEFLTSSAVTGILMGLGLLCAYIEIKAPGHIIFGLIAVICFGLVFGSRYLVDMASWWGLALFGLGLLLIVLEILVIPGTGIALVAGILMCVIGLMVTLVPNVPNRVPIPQTDFDWEIFKSGAMGMSIGVLCAAAAIAALAKYLPHVPLMNKLLLAPVTTAPDAAIQADSAFSHVKPGDVGTVEIMLRPVGKARFAGELVDVSSDGEWIEAPSQVRVLRREGNVIIVERIA